MLPEYLWFHGFEERTEKQQSLIVERRNVVLFVSEPWLVEQVIVI